MGFNIGDKVRIKEFRKEYINQGPGFTDLMKAHCGEVFTVTEQTGNIVRYKGWQWDSDWLELVEEATTEEVFDIDSTAFESILKIS